MLSVNKSHTPERPAELCSAGRSAPLRIAIVGAGAIGCYLGTLLSQSSRFDLSFIGREKMALESAAYGLTAQDLDGSCFSLVSPAVYTEFEILRSMNLILVTVKAVDLEHVLLQIAPYLAADAVVVALQNGVDVTALYQQYLTQTVIRAIVPFNVVKISPGFYVRTTGAQMVWQQTQHPAIDAVMQQLQRHGIESSMCHHIKAAEFGKLLLNLNNAINALTDIPLQQQLMQRPYRLLLAGAMNELLQLCRQLQISSHAFTSVPNTVLPWLLKSPTWLFKRLAKKMLAISPEARSSMWDDIQAGKTTEVDFLNGAVVTLAATLQLQAPINSSLVQLVKRKERGEPIRLSPQQALHIVQEAQRI